MVGRGLGLWCDTWSMGHPRPKVNFKGVWWGVAGMAWLVLLADEVLPCHVGSPAQCPG
ncbi:hypothetical protein Hanom_Chr12g01177211 [Helianthus anomalus]